MLSTSVGLDSGVGIFQFVFNFKFSICLKPEIFFAPLGPFPSHAFKHKKLFMNQASVPTGTFFAEITGGHHIFLAVCKGFAILSG